MLDLETGKISIFADEDADGDEHWELYASDRYLVVIADVRYESAVL